MDLSVILKSGFEVLLVAGTLWALFNDEKIADIEKAIIVKLRRKKFKVIKNKNTNYKSDNMNLFLAMSDENSGLRKV